MFFLPGNDGQAVADNAFSLGIIATLILLAAAVFGTQIIQTVQSIIEQLKF